MKTQFVQSSLRRVQLAAALVLSAALATPVRAQLTSQPAGVQQISDFTYRVWASNPTIQRGQVQLVDVATGRVIYDEYSSAVSFGHKFDVSQLPDGRYAFVVNVGKQHFRYALNLHTTATRSAELHADTVRTRMAFSASL